MNAIIFLVFITASYAAELSNISEYYCGSVGVDTRPVVMCIYTHGSRVFMIARVNLLSLAARLTTVSLDLRIRN